MDLIHDQKPLLQEYQQLILDGMSGVPEELEGVEFPLIGGGVYVVIERHGPWDTIFCKYKTETWFMTQTVWRTSQDLHAMKGKK